MGAIILNITPQTWFKVLPSHNIYFKIPLVCPKKCHQYRRSGNCPHVLQKEGRRIRRRIEQYNKYKTDVLFLAKKAGFRLPTWGWSVYFYFPMPSSWTKAKKEAMHGQPKLTKPDIDNLEKAFYDSLSITDEEVGQVSGHGKFWVKDIKHGHIEILLNQPVYNPFSVTFIDQREFDKRPKRKWVRRNKP